MDIIKFRATCERLFPNARGIGRILENGRDYHIREIMDINEKIDWMVAYHLEYNDNLNLLCPEDFIFNQKYLVLNFNGQDVGFLNLSLMIAGIMPIDIGWIGMTCASIGYVKPQFRSNGHQSKLLVHAINQHNCHMVQVSMERWIRKQSYFRYLGFRNIFDFNVGEVFVTTNKAAKKARQRGVMQTR